MNMINRLWWLTVLSHALLMAGTVALVLHTARHGGALLAALAVLPLALPLPGLLRKSPYTGGWASMVTAFYCPFYLSDAYMHPPQRIALVALAVLAAVSFAATTLWAKGAAKRAKQGF